MQFGWTSAFWWLTLIAPIVLFYILKVRLRRVPVSTTFFWEQVFEEKSARSIWQKLRHLLSLLLQLLFLLLVVLALSDPNLVGEWMKPRRIVLILDSSASMQATDEEGSRFAAATEDAKRMIDTLRWRDDMAIIASGSVPTVEVGLTSHQKTLREVVDSIAVTDGPGSIEESIATAKRLIAEHPNAEIHLLTDRQYQPGAKSDEAKSLFVHRFGEDADNVGITLFQVRRSLIDPVGFQILVEVSNFTENQVECRLNVDLGEEIVDVIPLELAPGEVWSNVLDHVTDAGGELVATINVDDLLSLDNVARAILPARDPQPVVLYSEENLFLRKVFEAIPYVAMTFAKDINTPVPDGAVGVFLQSSPEKIPAGNVLVIDPQESADLFQVGEPLENVLVASQDNDSDLMKHVKLLNVSFPGARKLTVPDNADVLVSSLDESPLYVSIEHDDGKAIVLTANLNEGDLPLRTAFPILISNALSWFQGEKGEWNEAYATGELVELSIEDEWKENGELFLRSPQGNETPLSVDLEQTTIGPLEESGIWSIVRSNQSKPDAAEEVTETVLKQLACNLNNDEESQLRVEADKEPEPNPPLAAGFGSRPVWFYLALFAFLLLTTEWYLYQRRWIS